jgi:hypothetical protein
MINNLTKKIDVEKQLTQMLINAHKLPFWGRHINDVYADFNSKYKLNIKHPLDTYKISEILLDDYAKNLINNKKLGVSLTGFGTSFSGGIVSYIGLPVEIKIYMRNIYNLSQELGYIYGVIPSPLIKNIEEDKNKFLVAVQEDTLKALALAFGSSTTSLLAKKVSQSFIEKEAKLILKTKVSDKMITKLSKEVAKLVGIKLTKKTINKSLVKWAPVVGGFVSGIINYYSFDKIANNLIKGLKKEREIYRRYLKELGKL